MKVNKIEVQNFRLLSNVSIALNESTTLIVGKNNSGKTSLTEVFYKFLGLNKASFAFEDFSLNCLFENTEDDTIPNFYRALKYYKEFKNLELEKVTEEYLQKEQMFKNTTPKILINIHIEYSEQDNISSLSQFIMDLDIERKDALISFEYSPINPEFLYRDYLDEEEEYSSIIEFLQKKFRSYFSEKIYAVDALNRTNRRLIEKKALVENVFLTRFIYAQRSLDDQAVDNQRKLSKGFEDYYKFNSDENEGIAKVEKSLEDASRSLDEQYAEIFDSIFADLSSFGVGKGVSIQKLLVKANLSSEKILKGSTQLFYENKDESLLPESYNGLGYSNLIYIVLRFISFYEEYIKRKPNPDFQLLFIEEPEAHLHPQMQQVFIRNIDSFIESKGWNIQIIITTHSSHIVSESGLEEQKGFENIRYFYKRKNNTLEVKNLSDYTNAQIKEDPITIKFLKQYLSITGCDMFFADKIILVEGSVEKLLLPLIIKKLSQTLTSQYVSIIEVGGAHAHKFKQLLEFLNIKTLIITDIDSINPENSRKACKVMASAKTSNQVLKQWIPRKECIGELLGLESDQKIQKNVRVAYQIPEKRQQACGRSFEEAFILANAQTLLENAKTLTVCEGHFANKTIERIRDKSYEIAGKIKKKTDFAFDILLLEHWEAPFYIKEGLYWLEKDEL